MKRFHQFGCAEHVRDALEVVSMMAMLISV